REERRKKRIRKEGGGGRGRREKETEGRIESEEIGTIKPYRGVQQKKKVSYRTRLQGHMMIMR
ncbi:hypothetical protein DV965_16370, partial [Staphylococcus pseudintermedius]|uniref:hypothetical protein n=1 Tax=Staphylococcus pseudintermedius TaxID=283734 RepID=UPI000E364784